MCRLVLLSVMDNKLAFVQRSGAVPTFRGKGQWDLCLEDELVVGYLEGGSSIDFGCDVVSFSGGKKFWACFFLSPCLQQCTMKKSVFEFRFYFELKIEIDAPDTVVVPPLTPIARIMILDTDPSFAFRGDVPSSLGNVVIGTKETFFVTAPTLCRVTNESIVILAKEDVVVSTNMVKTFDTGVHVMFGEDGAPMYPETPLHLIERGVIILQEPFAKARETHIRLSFMNFKGEDVKISRHDTICELFINDKFVQTAGDLVLDKLINDSDDDFNPFTDIAILLKSFCRNYV